MSKAESRHISGDGSGEQRGAHCKPQLNSEPFKKLGPALFAAILNEDPDSALEYCFPKAAYAKDKAIKNPAVDWERRLVAAFRRDVHEYHRGLKSGSGPSFLSLEISEPNTRWMKRVPLSRSEPWPALWSAHQVGVDAHPAAAERGRRPSPASPSTAA